MKRKELVCRNQSPARDPLNARSWAGARRGRLHRIRRWWERPDVGYDSQIQGRPIHKTREMRGRRWVTRCRSYLNRVRSIHIKCPVAPNARRWKLPMPAPYGKVTSRSGNRQTCTTAGPSALREPNHTRFCRGAVATCQGAHSQQAKLPNEVTRSHLLQHSTGANSTRVPQARVAAPHWPGRIPPLLESPHPENCKVPSVTSNPARYILEKLIDNGEVTAAHVRRNLACMWNEMSALVWDLKSRTPRGARRFESGREQQCGILFLLRR